MSKLLFIVLFLSASVSAQTDFTKAKNYFDSGKYTQAQPLFERYQQQHPEDLKCTEYLGDTQSHLGNWQSALNYYQKLKNTKPSEAEFQYKFGGAMAMLAQKSNPFKALSMIDDIRSAFEKTIQLNPQHIGARWALIELYLQLPGIFGGSEKKAAQFSDQLMKISAVDGYLSKGHIEEYYKRYSKAEQQYKKAIEIGNSKTIYQKLADLYKNKMAQPEKARLILAAYNEKNRS